MSLSHKDDYLETPIWLFKEIENITGLRFETDMCATDENSKCDGYIGEDQDTLKHNFKYSSDPFFCNPPRSKNGKFVSKVIEVWKEYNYDIVMLLCWNDLGNRYCDYLRSLILSGSEKIQVVNLGKIPFWKNGKPIYNIDKKTGKQIEFPSRLAYFWVWFKKQ